MSTYTDGIPHVSDVEAMTAALEAWDKAGKQVCSNADLREGILRQLRGLFTSALHVETTLRRYSKGN